MDKPELGIILDTLRDKPKELLEFVWKLHNDSWSRGYNQGKDDPDFEKEEE